MMTQLSTEIEKAMISHSHSLLSLSIFRFRNGAAVEATKSIENIAS